MEHNAQHTPAKVNFVHQNEKVMLLNQAWRLPNFDPNKQTWKLFLNQIPRMILTVIFLGAYVATMLSYQAKQPVDRGKKLVFDTVTTGLMLGIGLNFFEVFTDMARITRWRILSSRYFEVRDIDLILGAQSLMKVFQMMTRSYRKPPVFFICLGWLLVNIGAQISVAILPLFASLKSGYGSSGTTISQGPVSVPKLDCFYRSGMTECTDYQARLDPAVAHTYGGLGMFRGQNCSYHSTDHIKNSPQSCPYLIRNDRREFAVRYADSNPTDLTNAYPYYGTERIVTTAATNCNKYLPPLDPLPKASSTDGIEDEFVWRFENSTGTYSLTIPRSSLAMYSTTYIWNDTRLPPSATLQACGQRCVVMYALRDMYNGSNHEISIFQCHITVSPVSNTKHPAHVLSDSMARTAAASIALTGRWRSPSSDNQDWRQFQLYQDGAELAAQLDDSAEDVGARIAEFAAAALATMARRNPTTIIPGNLPTLGYQTDVEWKNTGALIASIAAAHLVLVLLILWLARPVIAVDDSYLVMARLLKELVETLSEGGELRLLQGRELAREVASSIGAGAGVGKAGESRPLLKRSPFPSARNLDDVGTTLGGDARGRKRKGSSEQAREDSASEMQDQGLPERTVHHMV